MNYRIWLRELKEGKNKKREDDKNTIVVVLDNEMVMLTFGEEKCLHVRDHQGTKWVVDLRIMHLVTSNKYVFASYRT